MELTKQQLDELVNTLVECSLEDTAFLTNRLYELVELKGQELYDTWVA